MTGQRIGYIRVSGVDQNPDRQLSGIELDRKFVEYASAKSLDREELKSMLQFVRSGDIIIIHSMDRLARNLKDLKNVVDELIKRKIKVQFIKENLTFTSENSPLSNLMLNLMGAFAEFEHSFIDERRREGIEVAKRLGKYKGSKSKMTDELIEKLKNALQTRDSKTKIAQDLGISRFALYSYMRKLSLK